jgi:PAS domain S-box-containing protein
MERMHSLLKRQLRRRLGDQFSIPKEWQEFINAVNDAYREFDTDRGMLERSLELSSQELLQANSGLRAVFEAIPDLMFRLDSRGTILAYEAGDTTHFLLPPEELVGRRIQDVPQKLVGGYFQEAIDRVQETKSIITIDYWLMLQDQQRWYEARLLPHLEDQIIVIIRDITEIKRSQEALRASEERLRLAWETSPDAFSISRLDDGTYVDVNKGYIDLTGYSRQEVLGRSALAVPIWHDPSDRELLVSALMRDGYVRNFETKFRLKNGEVRTVMISAGLMMLEGEPHLLGITKDIEELKQAQEALELSEERYRALFENAGDAIFILEMEGDDVGKIVSANRVAADMHGYALDDLLGLNIADLDAPEEIARLPQRIEQIRSGQWVKEEILHRKKDGTIFPAEVTAGPLWVKAHTYILSIDRDISERRRAEEKLRASEAKYRNILETIADGYHEVDLAGNLTLVNDSLCEILGRSREELLGTNYRQLMDEPNASRTFEAYDKVFRTGIPNPEFTSEMMRKDGSKRYVSSSISPIRGPAGKPTGFHGILRDITEQRNLEEQLRQAAKMEAIGRMAGGIAHDFNNLLTAIMGYSSILAGQLTEKGIESDKPQQINRSAERAAELTRQLLAFSRRQVLEMKVINANDLVRDMESMLRRLIGEDVELIAVLDPRLGNVRADSAQLGVCRATEDIGAVSSRGGGCFSD